jgi:hypothetical protein
MNTDKEYYSPADFINLPKYDAHTHYHTFDDLFVRKAKKVNLSLLTINTDFPFLPRDTQFEIAQSIHQRHPRSFDFIGTFDASAFASKTFAEDAVAQIKNCMAAGARGIKIWKNMGMTLKNDAGQYVMADDPVFAPIFEFIEKKKIPLLAHLGEPRNCWLPIEQMTIGSDRRYFSKNPDYHMYLHPEAPSYEQQITARDNLLERYPDMIFVGAHLGSMEWNLEEVAKRMDRFPNFYVDISGRFAHICEQTFRNRNYVINFFETYRNRIMYGLDYFVFQNYSQWWINLMCKYLPRVYLTFLFQYLYRTIKSHWMFFATDKVIKIGKINDRPETSENIEGLKLPKKTVDSIFYENVRLVYFNNL